jgi:hypothetical protein
MLKSTLPFTYLGLPLSLTKPTVADFWPLVSNCERRLVVFSSFLSEAGRLELTNAVLTALPTYATRNFCAPCAPYPPNYTVFYSMRGCW